MRHTNNAAADRIWVAARAMIRLWNIRYKTPQIPRERFKVSRHAVLQRSRNMRRIPFGENMAIQIFSFCFRNPPLIDAVILTGIPSRQIR